MAYLAGGMYFLAMPSCLLSTKVSWVDKQQALKLVRLKSQTRRLPITRQHTHLWCMVSFVVCLFAGGNGHQRRLKWKEKQRYRVSSCSSYLTALTHAWRHQGIWLGTCQSDMTPVTRHLPMSSWMVTRSSTLNEVSSFSGWLHRWHTKLTCMVVLVEDLEPSIAASQQTNDNTEHYLVSAQSQQTWYSRHPPEQQPADIGPVLWSQLICPVQPDFSQIR